MHMAYSLWHNIEYKSINIASHPNPHLSVPRVPGGSRPRHFEWACTAFRCIQGHRVKIRDAPIDSPDFLGELCSKVNLTWVKGGSQAGSGPAVWAYLNVRIADDLRGSKFGDTDYKYATHHELLGVLFFNLLSVQMMIPNYLQIFLAGAAQTPAQQTHTHVCMYVCMYIYSIYIYTLDVHV